MNLVITIAEICKNILKNLIKNFPPIQKTAWDFFKIYSTSSFKQNVQKDNNKDVHYAKADPFKIVEVDPRNIVYHTMLDKAGKKSHFKEKVFNPWENAGRIVGGDWDRLERKFT